tara:strand:+ start:390 stop:692 length:303 start_codon:yes stop_codon:yes gene_type:complete
MKNLFDPLWPQWEEEHKDVYESTADYTIEYDYDSNLILESLIEGSDLSSDERLMVRMKLQGFSDAEISEEFYGKKYHLNMNDIYLRMKEYFFSGDCYESI